MDHSSGTSRATYSKKLARHHEVFDRFSCWEGAVPEGFHVNFLGVVTRTSFFPSYFAEMPQSCGKGHVRTDYPALGEEYFEWIDLLQAVEAAEERFTMLELGAGWGRWIANAVAALKQRSNIRYTLIAVEAEPTHFRWMIQHLRDNRIDLKACELIEAAISGKDGTVGFYTGQTSFGDPTNWYGQKIGGPTEVRATSLNTLLRPLTKVDLIDLDAEGAELEMLEAASDELNEKVKKVHIDTYNREVESGLRSLFAGLGWQNVHDYLSDTETETEWGKISFREGVQTWVNPRFFSRQSLTDLRTRRIPTAVGFDLFLDPEDFLSKLLLRDGVFEAPETDLVTRLVRPGDTCIDAGCHVGYYSCLLASLVGPKGHVYAIDANPVSCRRTERNLDWNSLAGAPVTQAALGDRHGATSFYISTDNQTGLSSLGAIEPHKEVIVVPWLRLDDFLHAQGVHNVRLLKLDVEGSEEIVLRGLGRALASHIIDFILVECFDERLRLMNSSTESVAGILKSAGYTCWEFGKENSASWSPAAEVRSRGDCNYLFTSPTVSESVPRISIAGALAWAWARIDEVLNDNADLKEGLEKSKQSLEKSQEDTDWLLNSIKAHEEQLERLEAEKRQIQVQKSDLDAVWQGVQNSASWRVLNKWRRIRDRLIPDDTRRRAAYDSVLRTFRGRR